MQRRPLALALAALGLLPAACGDDGVDSGDSGADSSWQPTLDPWATPPSADVGQAPGQAWLEPDALTVHSKETVTLVYVVGEGGLGPGDALRIEDPVFHGMRMAKWATPTTDPTECGPLVLEGASGALVTVSTTGDAVLTVERSTLSTAIHAYATTDVFLEDGSLEEGDEVRVVFGDTTLQGGLGGPDCALQTAPRAFHVVPWRLWVQQAEDGALGQVLPTPSFDILARQEAAGLFVTAPSQGVVGQPVPLRVAVVDAYGNAVEDYEGQLRLDPRWGGQERTLTAVDGGVAVLDLVLPEGVHRVPVEVDGLQATSNPVKVAAEAPARSVWWGDIHTHHGNSGERADGTWNDDNARYARDVVGLDVSSESTKLRTLEIDGAGVWRDLVRSCEEVSVDGEHILLLGWEWLGGVDGHHNVYYDSCEGELGSYAIVGLADEGGLWAWLDAQERATGVRAVAIPHATLYTGYDWKRSRRLRPGWDRRFRTALEVYSHWGSSMEPAEDGGSMQSALAHGVRAGFIAASDNHTGWASNPVYRELDRLPGLAAFLAPELTREAIFEALQQRRTYATTGPRILVEVVARQGGTEAGPGELLAAGEPLDLAWEVHGTAEVAALRVVAVPVGGRTRVRVLHEEAPGGLDVVGGVQGLEPPRGEAALWLEIEQVDGHRAWVSPVFLEAGGCGGCAGSGPRGAGAGLAGLALLGLLRRRRAHAG